MPGKAEQEQVAGNGVAQQGGGDAGRIDEMAAFSARLPPTILPFMARRGKPCIRVEDKRRGGHFRFVDHGVGAALGDLAHRLVSGGDHQVGAQQQVGFAGGDAHGLDVLLVPADPHVADHGAEFLRQPGLVHGGAALALDMRRHGHQGGDGEHAGTADPGDHGVPGPLQGGQYRFRQRVEQCSDTVDRRWHRSGRFFQLTANAR